LVHEEHEATERVPIFDEDTGEPTGRFTSEAVERTWLLHDFVVAHGVSVSATTSPMPEVAAEPELKPPSREVPLAPEPVSETPKPESSLFDPEAQEFIPEIGLVVSRAVAEMFHKRLQELKAEPNSELREQS
jgi:hypothetical protein